MGSALSDLVAVDALEYWSDSLEKIDDKYVHCQTYIVQGIYLKIEL